jgi:uncharacterized lipoprotein YddW (UPF0748 family)
MRIKKFFPGGALWLISALSAGAGGYEPSTNLPPALTREFRGAWMPSTGENSWVAQFGKTTAEQKAGLISILDRAVQLRLNAIIFQIRPACDALYPSALEPWSEYLTGAMGRAPEPFYDPLAFVIEQAHQRGLELHAWINPYRALHKSHEGTVAPNHISRTHPELVRRFGQYLWLDPGEPAVPDYSLKVVMDVVKRYDVDGVQFDDYFYLSAEDAGVKNADFPDNASWKKFGARSGLNRDDWRRQNVNLFVERVYSSIKSVKPWVKFGISPFGIWRPGNPAQIKGSDAYTKYFADSRKWLQHGWLDYFSPQLYWQIDVREQSFPVLLDWWSQQNTKERHLWPGLAAYRAGEWKSGEITNQIHLARERAGVTGYALFSMNSLVHNTSLGGSLEHDVNVDRALAPASPWLGNNSPGKPNVMVNGNAPDLKLTWNSAGTNSSVRWWVVQWKVYSDWKMEILPGTTSSKTMDVAPQIIAVTAIDRFGNAGAPCVLEPRKSLPEKEKKPERKPLHPVFRK